MCIEIYYTDLSMMIMLEIVGESIAVTTRGLQDILYMYHA